MRIIRLLAEVEEGVEDLEEMVEEDITHTVL